MTKPEICDFCSSPQVIVGFLAGGIDMDVIKGKVIRSRGGWAACETCAALVLAEDRVGLFRRSMFTLQGEYPYALKVDAISHAHTAFWMASAAYREQARRVGIRRC